MLRYQRTAVSDLTLYIKWHPHCHWGVALYPRILLSMSPWHSFPLMCHYGFIVHFSLACTREQGFHFGLYSFFLSCPPYFLLLKSLAWLSLEREWRFFSFCSGKAVTCQLPIIITCTQKIGCTPCNVITHDHASWVCAVECSR